MTRFEIQKERGTIWYSDIREPSLRWDYVVAAITAWQRYGNEDHFSLHNFGYMLHHSHISPKWSFVAAFNDGYDHFKALICFKDIWQMCRQDNTFSRLEKM